MTYDPDRRHRQSFRLRGYDYSQAGAYFVTICVRRGECLLGEVVDGQVVLSPFGEIALACWEDLPRHYDPVILDSFVVMPNHVHGIIVLADGATTVGAGLRPAPTTGRVVDAGENPSPASITDGVMGKRHGLPEIMRAFKSFSARRINAARNTPGNPFWQRNYYEHIIRNERSYDAIREYIALNPLRWTDDTLHPEAAPNRFNDSWSRGGS